MKRILVVTIDVEPDCTPTWHYSNPLSFNGVSNGIGKILHPLFMKYGIVPTYLINNVVLEDKSSVKVLSSLKGDFELGTHLHPEFIEPEKEHHDYGGKKGIANCCYYPEQIESAKIKSITQLFKNAFGYSPTSFRAGRFSAGVNTINSLAAQGYLVDSSVTPHINWDDQSREHPVDYTHAPEQPYWMNTNSMDESDRPVRILEVPVTIAIQKRNPLRELVSSGAGLIHSFRKYKNTWLRPFYSTADEMISIVEQYQLTYQKEKMVVFNLMFHNVEVIPGLSPYTKNTLEAEVYLQELEKFLAYCSINNIRSSRLSNLYEL